MEETAAKPKVKESGMRQLLLWPLSLLCFGLDAYLVEQRWRREGTWFLAVSGLMLVAQLLSYIQARRRLRDIAQEANAEIDTAGGRFTAFAANLAEIPFSSLLANLFLLLYVSGLGR